MSKIASLQNQYLSRINEFKHVEQQLNRKEQLKTNEVSDSVVAKVKPELDSATADSLVSEIASKLQNEPSNALEAQGNLDEDKIMALLADDDE